MNLPENIRNFIEKEAELDSGRAQKIQVGINMFSQAHVRGAEALYRHLLSIGPEFDETDAIKKAQDSFPSNDVNDILNTVICRRIFIDALREQHQQSVAIIAARDAELKEYERNYKEICK